MPLIIENGSIVADANSYVTVSDARGYAVVRSIVLPVADADVEVLIVKAMDYVEAMEDRFPGDRVSGEQVLAWPRTGVTLNGFEVAETAIPKLLKDAVCQLTCDAMTIDLLPNGTGREVVKQKVDVIETTYAQTGSSQVTPVLGAAMALLDRLFRAGTGGLTLGVGRA
jgi:hypothetical protein